MSSRSLSPSSSIPCKISELVSSNSGSYPCTPVKTKRTRLRPHYNRSNSDTSLAETEVTSPHKDQWIMYSKAALAKASTVAEIKPHLFTLLDRFSRLESELKMVQAERDFLQKEMNAVKKQRVQLLSPFKSISTKISRGNSAGSLLTSITTMATTTKAKPDDTNVYTGKGGVHYSTKPTRRKSMGEKSIRRKSVIGTMKFVARKTSDTHGPDAEEFGLRTRSQSVSELMSRQVLYDVSRRQVKNVKQNCKKK